jgi:hypothetical protein
MRVAKRYRCTVLFRVITFGIFSEKSPFAYEEPGLIPIREMVGYFQNWKYVEKSWSKFGSEIEKAVSEITFPDLGENILLIHLRRGDLVNLMDSMGILGFGYYSKAVDHALKNLSSGERSSVRIFAVTDDYSGSLELSKKLGVEKLFGPEDLSAWETLA